MATKNVEYKSDFDTVQSMKVSNFKVNSGDALGQGKISIEINKQKNQNLLVFRNKVKISLYTGFLIPKVS